MMAKYYGLMAALNGFVAIINVSAHLTTGIEGFMWFAIVNAVCMVLAAGASRHA